MKEYNQVFTFKHLYNSYKKCIKSGRWKVQNQRFISNDIFNINKIYKELLNHTYKMSETFEFDIIERGKPRHISAYSLRDRIVQRCLCDYFLTPLLSKSLIYDCGATIKNKGTFFAKRRTAVQLNKYFKKYGSLGYCLTIDIHHYFENIDIDLLLQKLRKVVKDEDLFNLISIILKDNKKGLGLGSQISQICALFFLSELDHFIKEKLHIKLYNRYMDDLYLIHNDKKYLYKCFDEITKKVHELKLMLNHKKSKVHLLTNGFQFLKVKWVLKEDGRIIKLLTTQTFNIMKRKICKGLDISTILPSWLDYISHFDCYNKYIKFKDIYL